MAGIQELSLFIFSCLLLNITPGPDSLLVMTRTAAQGWRAGTVAALGIGSGVMVHILAAALGLSALLATSAMAFTVVKVIGVVYLIYLGLSMLLRKKHPASEQAAVIAAIPLSYGNVFLQGFLTNVLNPKVALFFVAFVPQFIVTGSADKAWSFIILGCIFNLSGMAWCFILVAVTSFASKRTAVSRTVTYWLEKGIGALFVGFGIKLALSARS